MPHPTAPSHLLAARILPADRLEARRFRSTLQAELKASVGPARRMGISLLWPILKLVIPILIPALIQLIARFRREQPDEFAVAMERVSVEPTGPIALAILYPVDGNPANATE